MRTGGGGCGVVVWFGKDTDIACLVLLFGFTQPIYSVGVCGNLSHSDTAFFVVESAQL